MYFLMVALDRSWVVPLTVMLVVPISARRACCRCCTSRGLR